MLFYNKLFEQDGEGGEKYTGGTGIDISQKRVISIDQDVKYTSNIDIKGSLINDNGVLSNFSNKNYAQIPKVFAPELEDWVVSLKIKTSKAEDRQPIEFILGNYDNAVMDCIEISIENEHFVINIPYNDGDWSGSKIGTAVVQPDTVYWLRLSCSMDSGYKYKLEYSTDGETLNTDIEFISNFALQEAFEGYCLGIDRYTIPNNNYFRGEIDLTACSIYINEDEFWLGAEKNIDNVAKATNKLYGLIKPDNESMKVEDGILSFAGACYVVEDNKTEKYRLWSNKKLECRGILRSYAGTDGVLVTLPKAYADQNDYEIFVTVREQGNYFICCEPLGYQTFKVRISNTSGTPVAVNFSWKTEGYTN